MNLISLVITPELLRLITEIDEFKGNWQASSNPITYRCKEPKERLKINKQTGCRGYVFF